MKRGTFKYYLSTFIMVFVFVIILTIISHSQGAYFVGGSLDVTGGLAKEFSIFLYKGKTFILGKYLFDIGAIVVVPIIFTLLFVLIDILTNKLKSKKRRLQEEESEKYDKFVDEIGNELNKAKLFNIEDFRHFRENEKFQECLKKLFKIYSYGETQECNYFLVLRKFEKGTQEKKAISCLVTYTQRKIKEKEDEAKYQKTSKKI